MTVEEVVSQIKSLIEQYNDKDLKPCYVPICEVDRTTGLSKVVGKEFLCNIKRIFVLREIRWEMFNNYNGYEVKIETYVYKDKEDENSKHFQRESKIWAKTLDDLVQKVGKYLQEKGE
jgi:hypothetical protein